MSNELEKLKMLVESSCFHFAEDLAKPIETALKALEIIKEKQVNVEIFVEVIKQFQLRQDTNSRVSLWTITGREEDAKEKFQTELELYNRTCLYGLNHLSQEEFDLLTEVLK